MSLARKPRQRRTRPVTTALSPVQIEAIRRSMTSTRDRTLVSVLAYAGLRPGEVLHLRWSDVRDDMIIVRGSLSNGEEKDTKTGWTRTVDLELWLARDLREYRIAQGRPGDSELLFEMQDGRPWNNGKWRRWSDRVWDVAVSKAGLPRTRPYDLRHARASQLVASGASIVEIATQLGHSPTMTLNTYSHTIDEFKRRGPIDLETEVRNARTSDKDVGERLTAPVTV